MDMVDEKLERPPSRISRLTAYMCENIDANSHVLEASLLLLAFAIGMQDAVAAVDFHCFASNQTGNTVLLAVGLITPQAELRDLSLPLENVGISLSIFVAGVFVCGQIANLVKSRQRRWWMLASSTVQTLLVFVAAGVQWWSAPRHVVSWPGAWTVLALLALSSGMQVGMIRCLRITDITTAMATATYVDLMIDPALFVGPMKNRARNRRTGFLIALGGGACVGAVLRRHFHSPMTLMITAVIKVVVCVLIAFNPREKVVEGADS